MGRGPARSLGAGHLCQGSVRGEMRGIFAGGGGRGGGFLILHCPVGGGWGGAGRSVPVGLVFCSLSRGAT